MKSLPKPPRPGTAALAATQAKLDEATDAVENEEQALGNFVNESEQTLTKLKQASKTCQETANSLTAETNRRIDSSSSLKQEIQTIEGAAKINHDKKSDLESAKKGKADKLANLKTQIVDFNSRKYRAEANLSKAEKKAEHCLLEESNRVEKLRKNAAKVCGGEIIHDGSSCSMEGRGQLWVGRNGSLNVPNHAPGKSEKISYPQSGKFWEGLVVWIFAFNTVYRRGEPWGRPSCRVGRRWPFPGEKT